MVEASRERLSRIKRIDQLIAYLREELDWPIDSDNIEEITYDYTPDELGIDSKNAAKIETIKQLMPLSTNQPWGIFFVKFERKHLPVVALRRILGQLVIKKRASSKKSDKPSWRCNDLLFISSYGEEALRQISLAHFTEDKEMGDLPTLKVLGWDGQDTNLHLDHVADELNSKLRWPDDEGELETWREQWTSAFTLRHQEVITTSRELAVRLAKLARSIRQRANSVLAIETETGPLRTLMKGFKEALIHDLEEDNFADMYAQTIAYGLLSARVSRPAGLVADNIADMVPVTNPFLKEMMETFLNVGGRKKVNRKGTFKGIDFDELGINDVVDLLRQAHMEAVLRDFGNLNPQEDPVIHFYELFLKEYDPKMRMQRGVFYTPRSVVSFIVRSVDEILRDEFGLDDGLADTTTWGEMIKCNPEIKLPKHTTPEDPFVQILDPATGTGTFLVEVIGLIYNSMAIKWKSNGSSGEKITSLWNEYVPKHLLPRLYGFELLMAPYAIAHMKIGLKLTETGYLFKSKQRAQIFLANSLEPHRDIGQRDLLFEALAHEAEKANHVKKEVSITVVVGNPPYSHMSQSLSEEQRRIVEPYRYVDGLKIKERGAISFERNLQDDYVKFIRFAQMRIEQTLNGVCALITNHAYLSSLTLRGMRGNLHHTFRKILLLDLHGNSKIRESTPNGIKDENVFDIQQGVAISIFMASSSTSLKNHIKYGQIWGLRDDKYRILLNDSLNLINTEISPKSPSYFYIPRNDELAEEYEKSFPLDYIFKVGGSGITSDRNKLTIAFNDKTIQDRFTIFNDSDKTDTEVKNELEIKENSTWSVAKARRKLRGKNITDFLQNIDYRPFDKRRICYHDAVVQCPRHPTMRHLMGGENIAIVTCRQQAIPGFRHVFVTRELFEEGLVSNKSREKTAGYPLFVVEKNPMFGTYKSVNIKDSFLRLFERVTGLTWNEESQKTNSNVLTPWALLHYIYSILYSPSYRLHYEELLKEGFPRIPIPTTIDLYNSLCIYGADLVAIHLLEDNYCYASWNSSLSKKKSPIGRFALEFVDSGSTDIDKGYPKYKEGKVIINSNGTGFEKMSENVWDFHVGSYRVCEKWLKDRRGRNLTKDDISHYKKIVAVINETIRLMTEIDKVIDKHGGWPDAFITS